MAPTAPCRYFQMGSCSNGSSCSFAHIKSQGVCEFYLKGDCRFGSYCQLSHTKPKNTKKVPKRETVLKTTSIVVPVSENRQIRSKFERIQLCPFHMNGECTNERECKYLHGLQCKSCGKNSIEPGNNANDSSECQKCHDGLNDNQECAVCFEIVLEKQGGKFGLLSCNHCVCLKCIRSWRSTETVSTSKTCPICRCSSYFVVPSLVWPKDAAEKERIVQEYKSSLQAINCKHFNKGQGTCPFGSSCFYSHVDKYGVDQKNVVRLLSNSEYGDEGLKVMPQVSLSDFLN